MAAITWTNPVSGNFNTAADWTGGVVPGPGDDALLDAPGALAYTVTVTADHTVQGFQTAQTATLELQGAGVELSISGVGVYDNAGHVVVGDGTSLHFQAATLVNGGAVELDGGADTTSLVLNFTKLSGGGQILLSDGANNIVKGSSGPENVDNTISGAGQIGNGAWIFDNDAAGVIDATGTYNPLVLNLGNSGFHSISNLGLIEATGAAGLVIKDTIVIQTSGTAKQTGEIYAGAGSTVTLETSHIFTGILAGPGSFVCADSQDILGGGTATLSNYAHIKVSSGMTMKAIGIINSGTVEIAGSSADTELVVEGKVLGGGSIVMDDGSSRLWERNLGDGLTSDNTISGSGRIGAVTLTNEAAGAIDANGAAGMVWNNTGYSVSNAGLIEAVGAGSLTLSNATVEQSGAGAIVAANGGRVFLHGVDLRRGLLMSSGGGKAVFTGAAGNDLNGVAQPLTIEGLVVVSDGAALTLEGTIDNTGQVSLAGHAQTTSLTIGATNATLEGGGTLTMSGSTLNHVFGAAAGATLTNVDNRILGAGVLGDAGLTLINAAGGVINGDKAAALVIKTGTNTIVNAGRMASSGAGGVTIMSAVDNTGVLAAANGDLTVEGAVTGAGQAQVSGAVLDFASAFSENVFFSKSPGATGTLELAQSQAYAGKVFNFSTTGGTKLDLDDIAFGGATSASYSGTTASGVLTVSDGTHTANIRLQGDYTGSAFTISNDGSGGTLVVDPPAAAAPRAAAPLTHALAGFGARSAGGARLWDSPPRRPYATLARPT
jgi:hypothetical protein